MNRLYSWLLPLSPFGLFLEDADVNATARYGRPRIHRDMLNYER